MGAFAPLVVFATIVFGFMFWGAHRSAREPGKLASYRRWSYVSRGD
jgi:hypothetical protein